MNATAFQRKMYNDAMGEHDRTCCTADEPCRMRAALTQGMGSMDLAPDVQAAGRSFDRKTGSYAEPTTPVVLEDGMYRVDGVVYKVQHAVHGSGRQYAKRLTQYGNDWTFEYAAGAIRKLRPEHRMTLDEAREFGALYGVCCRCGTTLTDEESIARGIGPVCAEKF